MSVIEDTSVRIEKTPKNSRVNSDGYTPPKTAKSIRRSLARLAAGDGGTTPPSVLGAILRAEIGEVGVVHRPPPQLLATLKRSTGDFAAAAQEGFPRRIKWRRVCGPELSPAQMTDYIETEEDLRLRNPRQPDSSRVARRARAAASVDGAPSDWQPCMPSDATLPDLPIPEFLRCPGGKR
jgi:hypothetical protein